MILKPGRNDPCPCGSGKKYKKCCQGKNETVSPAPFPAKTTILPSVISNELLALFNAGLHLELESRARTLLDQFPDSAFAWKMLGAALKKQGKDALPAFRKAVEFSPNSADAHNNLGLVLHERGQHEQAINCYRKALQLDASHAEIYLNLGNSLQELNFLDSAIASYRKALELQSNLAEAYSCMGSAQRKFGQLEASQASYRKALELQPNNAETYGGMGILQRDLGQIDNMTSSYQRALELNPDYIEAHLELVNSHKVKEGNKNFEALVEYERAMRAGTAVPIARIGHLIHFALGKGYDDLREYDKAFSHFMEGARLRRATFRYDPVETSRRFDSIMRNLDAAAIERLRGGGEPSPQPIFILGMPRSGTTLVEQIISSHPAVHGAGELPYLMEIAEHEVKGASFPDNLARLDQTVLAAWGNEYVKKLQQHAPSMARITDKMPGNFQAVGLIHLMLPNARIIHTNRNPLDTCLSCFTNPFAHGQEYSYQLAELGQYYVDYHRLMQHWRNVLPEGAFLDVQYEALAADQEAQSRRIIEYCGLEWNDACLEFHKNRRAVQTASVTQVRQPMYKSSMERWRHYEKFLGPLFDALGDLAPERPHPGA